MTKLLGQSKQPAAYMLQDYLYELFYKVETEGTVSRDDVVSRKKLLALSDEVLTYKSLIEKTQTSAEIAKEEAKQAIDDYAVLELENNKLLDQINQLENDNTELSTELEVYKNIASKMAKYVRVKSKAPPDEAYSESLDDLDDSDITEATEDNKESIRQMSIAAAKAKNDYLSYTKTKNIVEPKIIKRKVDNQSVKSGLAKYYLMRSVEAIDADLNYQWSITNNQLTDEHLEASELFMSGSTQYVKFHQLCYRQLHLSEDKKNMMVLFLELINGITDEQTIERLVS
jgi:hypothetical protein